MSYRPAPGGCVRTGVLQGGSTALRIARTLPRQGSSQLAFFRAVLPPSGTPVAPGRPKVPFLRWPRQCIGERTSALLPRIRCAPNRRSVRRFHGNVLAHGGGRTTCPDRSPGWVTRRLRNGFVASTLF